MQRGRRPVALATLIALSVVGLAACSGTSQSPTAQTRSAIASTPVVPSTGSATASATPSSAAAPSAPHTTPAPTPTTSSSPTAPALPAGAYVDVSVATLWHSPTSPRAVDAPALSRPAQIRSWLSAMALGQRLDLNGRVDSQVLMGERVVVDREQGSWAHVVVPDQPTPLDARGYPGWIPLAQLAFRAPPDARQDAVVISPTAWLYAGSARVFEVSMATRLPVLGIDSGWVHTQLPDGTAASVRSADVAVVNRGAAALPPTGADVARTAHLFDGLPYLWGGTSGFGFDCSGLTHLVYAMRGVTIPRDADAQARAGTAVSRNALQPGDLIFFARNGFVHHVGIYVGDGMMLHAPQTGSVVQVVSLSTQPYAGEYWGARRYPATGGR